MTAPTLRVQSILYLNEAQHVRRYVASLARSVELARTMGVLGSVKLALGDCSPSPVFDADDIAELAAHVEVLGIDELAYQFFDANLGSAAGHNRLLTTLTDDYVLIMNPDTVAAPDLLQELLAPFSRQSKVGLVEARQLPFEHPKPYDPVTGETPWATTACALVPRAVIAEVHGFDADAFFLYADDVDFSWRIRLAGHRILMRPTARIFHDKRLDHEGNWAVGSAEEYYSAEAALMMAHKYSRPDLVEKFRRDLSTYGSPLQQKAVVEFDQRQKDGTLPEPIDPDGKVAEFIDGVYSKHRF
jgi:hypothetical protein